MDRTMRRRRMERRIVEFLLIGKGVREICRELETGDRRVRRIRALAEAHGYLGGERALPAFPESLFPENPSQCQFVSKADRILLSHCE